MMSRRSYIDTDTFTWHYFILLRSYVASLMGQSTIACVFLGAYALSPQILLRVLYIKYQDMIHGKPRLVENTIINNYSNNNNNDNTKNN